MSGAFHLPQASDLGYKIDTDSRMAFLENYCKSHPLDDFADAVYNLMAVLQNRKTAPNP
jgi:hypothetical protein